MKPIYLIGMFFVFGIGLYLGGLIEHRTHVQLMRQNRILNKQVERFENYTVFSHAEYVAQLTGTPLYQILTGKKASN